MESMKRFGRVEARGVFIEGNSFTQYIRAGLFHHGCACRRFENKVYREERAESRLGFTYLVKSESNDARNGAARSSCDTDQQAQLAENRYPIFAPLSITESCRQYSVKNYICILQESQANAMSKAAS